MSELNSVEASEVQAALMEALQMNATGPQTASQTPKTSTDVAAKRAIPEDSASEGSESQKDGASGDGNEEEK